MAGVGLLELLPQLYGNIWVPRLVMDEYQVKAPSTEPHLSLFEWLHVVENVVIDPTLPLLDVGEAAISLAQSVNARHHPYSY